MNLCNNCHLIVFADVDRVSESSVELLRELQGKTEDDLVKVLINSLSLFPFYTPSLPHTNNFIEIHVETNGKISVG